jgi:hypothetical protein
MTSRVARFDHSRGPLNPKAAVDAGSKARVVSHQSLVFHPKNGTWVWDHPNPSVDLNALPMP